MSWNELAVRLAEILLPVMAAMLIALLGYASALLRKKIEDLDSEMTRRCLRDALDEAEVVATDAIRATNQVFVDALKSRSTDGKLTREEARQAMEKAKTYFAGHLTAGSLSVLEAALGPVSKWLEGFLEARIAREKAAVSEP